MVWNPYDQYGLAGKPAPVNPPPSGFNGNSGGGYNPFAPTTPHGYYGGSSANSGNAPQDWGGTTTNVTPGNQIWNTSGGNVGTAGNTTTDSGYGNQIWGAPSYSNGGGGSSNSSGSSSGGGSGGSNSGGGGVTPNAAPAAPTAAQAAATAAAAKAAAAAAAKAQYDATHETIAIPDPAADPTYKYQHAALEKALMNYQSGQTLGATQYNTNYNEGLNKLGWDGQGWSQDNQGAYAQARGDNTSDYASRGLGRSSNYADSLGMIDKTFNDQKSGLDRSKSDYTDTQRSALGAYTDQNAATDHGALLDAISRIATQKGVDLSAVTPGKVGSVTRLK